MKQRIDWIDNIRAIAMISMVVYHAVWDLVYLYGVNWMWYRGESAFVWQQSICWTFILLSGFCWSFSKNPVKQGMLISAGGLIVTVVTFLFSYSSRIIFGVLTFLGAAAFFLIFLKKWFEKIPSSAGLTVMFLAFSVTYGVNDGYLGIFKWKLVQLPKKLYVNLLTTFLGFPKDSFFSADYFSIFPWIFLYFAGYFLFRLWKEKKISGAECLNYKIPVLTKLGKKSLLVYLLHQPLIYLMLQLTFCS